MKKLLLYLSAIIIATACSSDSIEPEFRVMGSDFELMSEGGEISIGIINNVSYGISIDGSWITQDPGKGSGSGTGTGSGTLVFSVAENPTNDLRKGTITFTSADAGVTAVVNVSQYGLFEIYYTNYIEDHPILHIKTDAFGSEILSNTYEGGKGTIKFNGPVTEIGDIAFPNAPLSSIDLPNTITRIGSKAFFRCERLKALEIPSSVTTIEEEAFSGCTSLKDINLPDGLKIIKDKTFYGCNVLNEINLPNGLEEIGNYAFWHCNLTGITIPDKVKQIGEYAFYGNMQLPQAAIPSGVTEIKKGTFQLCQNLKEISIPDGVKSIGEDAFLNCNSLARINIPSSVTSIGIGAFGECHALKEVKVPAGVKTIELRTFFQCQNLQTVELPASITTIGYAFSGCNNLTALKCLATNPPALKTYGIFAGPYEFNLPNLKIYVPEGSVEAYRNADAWKNHADIIFPLQ